jgi:predicted aconitase with swiveling domain
MRSFGCLGQQVQAAEAETLRRQQAQISVFAGVQGSGSERGIEYSVPVQNTGASVASQIAVELVDGSGSTVGTSALVPALVSGEKAYAAVVTPPRERFTGPYEIFFAWDDGRGRNRAASGVQVGAP